MPKILIVEYDKSIKRSISRRYNTDKARFICNTPEGRLLKKPYKCNFYIYNPKGKTNREQIRELHYLEAKELIRKYGTREQFCEFFTVLNPDGSYRKNQKTTLRIDEYHRVKLFRTASLLSMKMSECVEYLIDKYDDMNLYNKLYVNHRKNGRTFPADISEFTS